MRCALVLTALAATFAIGTCQFQFLARRQEEDGSSFSSMTSWSFGQDGEVHKQTKTSSTESEEDGSVMKKRTVCTGNHCIEVIEVIEPPPMPTPMWVQDFADDTGFNPQPVVVMGPEGPILADAGFNPMEGHMQPELAFFVIPPPQSFLEMQLPAPQPPCATQMDAPLPFPEMQPQPSLRGMLNGLIENLHAHQQQQQQLLQQQQQPPVIVEPMRNVQVEMELPSGVRAIFDRLSGNVQLQRPQEPREIMIDASGNGPEIIVETMPESLTEERIRRWFGGAPREAVIEIEIPRPPPQYQAPKQASDMTFVRVAVAIVALGAAFALVMSALNLYRVFHVSGRESPLREFAEPLAPDSVNVAIPGAVARKAVPVRMYLSSLYTRASAKTEARGVQTYMARLYARILA